MQEKKPLLIIVEGAQGAGKTTFTNMLREMLPATNLLRLSGVKDKSPTGAKKSYKCHKAVLKLIEKTAGAGMNYILDRSHFTEQVYCRLGLKEHSFEKEAYKLTDRLFSLCKHYRIAVVLLTSDEATFRERLQRDKHSYQEFSVVESLRQQSCYIRVLEEPDFPLNYRVAHNATQEELVAFAKELIE